MATDEDARAAARRIVEQVLTNRDPSSSDPTPAELVEEVVDEVVDDATDERTGQLDPVRAAAVVEGAVAGLAAADGPQVPASVVAEPEAGPSVSDARARARALVAEVLEAHEAAAAATSAGAVTGGAAEPSADRGPATAVAEPAAELAAEPAVSEPAADSPARLRARELVAAAIADAEARQTAEREAAEAREATARAAAEAEARARDELEAARAREREAAQRIEEARRAEAERAEAERERQEALERARREEEEGLAAERERARAEERERVLAAERERELWADADRDLPAAATPVPEADEAPAGPDRTVPLSVAELAASGHATDRDPSSPAGEAAADDAVADGERLDDPEHTIVLPLDDPPRDDELGRTVVVSPDGPPPPPVPADTRVGGATGTLAPPRVLEAPAAAPADDGRTTAADAPAADEHEGAADASAAATADERPHDPRVLEAVVELDALPSPTRGGRWLLVSVLGAITLAIVFPLAIRALLQLVALS